MKKGQLIGISVALVAGFGAFALMRGIVNRPALEHTVEVQVNSAEVLVAAEKIDLGTIVSEGVFRWQKWPQDAVGPAFITNAAGPEAATSLIGSIARAPILAGEPITNEKLIKAGQGGVLSAILPAGKRAVSTKISEATAAGRLILPNDHVDVLLIRRLRGKTGEELTSETLFRNIRVLAVGQQIQNKEGDKSAAADTATLELSPQQAEVLALANVMGEISLSLRSIADIPKKDGSTAAEGTLNKKDQSNSIKILKYGNKSQVSSVN